MREIKGSAIATLLLAIVVSVTRTATPPPDTQTKNLVEVPRVNKIPGGKPLYAASHAVIIGIDKYPNLPPQNQLSYAAKDAIDFRDVLTHNYAFDAKNVLLLTNEQATRENIRKALVSFADSTRIGPDDRVLVYFSGHGQTIATPDGGEMGYILPSDAKVDLANPKNAAPYLSTCLPMRQIWDYLGASPAKHALVICDACFSGLLAQTRGVLSKAAAAVLLSRKARVVLTAGSKGELSTERADLGHGVFTSKLIQELKSRAAIPGQVFTASDLYSSLQSEVATATDGKQTPQMGNFETDGDVLFVTGGFAPPTIFTDPSLGTGVTVSVDSDPEGAEVIVNGVDSGKVTPADVPVIFPPKAVSATVKLDLTGYDPAEFTVKNTGKDVMLQGKLHKLHTHASTGG